jgi:AraC family transcriptional regulator
LEAHLFEKGNSVDHPNTQAAHSVRPLEAKYYPSLAIATLEPRTDRIRVLVTGEQGAFDVTYETPDGQLRRAIVRGPHVCVIPANRPHKVAPRQPSDMLVLSLSPAYFATRCNDGFGSVREVRESYGVVDAFLRGIGDGLSADFRAGREPDDEALESLAIGIAMHLATHYNRETPSMVASVGLPPQKLQRVLAVIEERLAESIQVRDLAGAISMSPFHFTRMFKRATGLTPHAYITERRMEQAKRLLTASELALVEVAASVGYQTQAHFTGVFHKHVGTTPRVFRLGSRGDGVKAPAAEQQRPRVVVQSVSSQANA